MKLRLVLAALLTFSTVQSFAGSFPCMVRHLRINSHRMFVQCHTKWDGLNIPVFVKDIPFYSASLDQKNVSFMIDLIQNARGKGKAIKLFYDASSSNLPNGCKGHNCRRLMAVGMNY